ncbi:AAA family ATPase [Carboxylicivirga caseinilyticus]|uniref:AAA family ATPase n=1 Tax=Carboxylicivirga caseinilyticus TaxID=3417572 RepID=UPI003D340858|nr:AAA family ATPase [Marinilabiliaceae bacterium A049]
MRLAAIYIEDHEYIFKEPQTINFGGQYFYEFENVDNNIIVRRTVNEKFIPDFFNLTELQSKVTNLNAIVGQNGAGKSTLLDVIRSEFIEHEYALPQSNSLFLVEIEGKHPLILRNDFNRVFLHESAPQNTYEIELKKGVTKKPQTIYYSPHFDYKYNPNFDEVDNHDISFDKIVEEDLKEFREKDTNESGWPYSASQELLFKNSIRQITFISSELVRKQIFNDLFELQGHYEPILHFRGYNVREKDWNTPYQLRTILKTIEEKLEKELSEWHTIRKFKDDRVLNQVEVNQYILKRNLIRCIISLLHIQMERRNSFLQEGYFPYEELKEQIDSASAYDTFLLFVKHSGIKLKSSKPENIFSESIVKKLLEKIYEAIEKTDNEDSVSNGTLRTSTEDATEILKLQRQFLNELNSYYVKFYANKDELTIEDREKIEEFINYMPFKRRMSSGEGALLNFYSRIYDFLNTNLKELKYRKLSNHYILLLDEADLTFHITWKKKYVKALLSTLPYFFDELENKPTLEIIFTTHDPITLSDLPNTNVIYIERPDYSSPSRILDFNNKRRPLKTFGANISDLIADSFFIEDSLIGNFALDKIQETIKWLNNKDNLESKIYYKTIIKLIDEPIIQRKLAEMYDDKTQDNFQADVIDEQIKKLQELRKRLGE